MVEIVPPVLGNTDDFTGRAALRDVDEKPVTGFLRKKTETDNFAG
jgi:hypothetical protein